MKISKYKSESTYSYTLGTTLTIELLENKVESVICIYIHSKYRENKTLETLIQKHNLEVLKNDKIFNILSSKENCFVIGVFNKFSSNLEDNKNHIVLVNPNNQGNLGTIIRSCVGFNVNSLAIIKPSVDIFDPKVIRSSMGSIFKLNYEYFDSFDDYLKKYQNNIYTFMLNGEKSLNNTTFKTPCSLVFGPEDSGLSDEYLKYNSVVINHSKNIDSLNLQVAVSVSLFVITKNIFN